MEEAIKPLNPRIAKAIAAGDFPALCESLKDMEQADIDAVTEGMLPVFGPDFGYNRVFRSLACVISWDTTGPVHRLAVLCGSGAPAVRAAAASLWLEVWQIDSRLLIPMLDVSYRRIPTERFPNEALLDPER